MSCSAGEPTLFPELVEQIKEAGPNGLSEPERQALVLGVLSWCRRLARDFAGELRRKGRAVEVDDMEGEAFLAAAEAAQYYDPRRGVAFTTFVRPWVQTHLIAVTDPRYTVAAAAMEFPERVTSREDGPEEIERPGPDADARRVLGNLAEPARSVVRLSVFDGLTPGRIAVRLDMPLKDVRLHLRNAAARLGKVRETDDAVADMIAAAGNG
jgi:DNA-directed RNA polymerase specialized sigma24 family protein